MSSAHATSTYVPKSRLAKWFESRLPLVGLVHSSFVAFPVPRNLNYFWTFGAILARDVPRRSSSSPASWLAMHYASRTPASRSTASSTSCAT
jgi:ubiquinol-cytochrome c reductase cytochrome b/c1 subunit